MGCGPLYGTYRIGKAAREIVRERSKAKTVEQDFDLYI
jgi:hypothetical protein